MMNLSVHQIALSRPTSTVSSGASLSKTISPSVTYLGSTYEYSESTVIATLLGSVVQSRGGINKFQKYVVLALVAETHAPIQKNSRRTQQAGRRTQRTKVT
jgi:hypothetical protein